MELETFLASAAAGVAADSARNVLALAAAGSTVPFIARYRQEQMGRLDEAAIRAVLDAKDSWEALLARQAFIVEEIERQKKLTPELRQRILGTFDREVLEDLYLPYKRKREDRAGAAREAGLEPLADWIWNTGHGLETPQPGQTLDLWAFTFRDEEKGVPDAEAAIRGAADILVERLAESLELRALVRREMREKGWILAARGPKAKPGSKYEKHFDQRAPVASLMRPESSHRYLALRRGVAEGELELTIGGGADDPGFEKRLLEEFERAACTVADAPGEEVLGRVARTALREHVVPSVEGEVHKALKQVADDVAIEVLAESLRRVLLAAPLGAKPVLGVAPGARGVCGAAVVDAAGRPAASWSFKLDREAKRETAEARPEGPPDDGATPPPPASEAPRGAGDTRSPGRPVVELVRAHGVEAVAVGNAASSREVERLIRAALAEAGIDVPVVPIDAAAASVWAASEDARAELPRTDPAIRAATSVARRLQDPLAELVKVEPRHAAAGQYPHDLPPHRLKRRLEQVVEWCVNQVGVDLNTASEHLLARVAGITPALASAIVEHRTRRGPFRSRRQLLEVPLFEARVFEQAAGFVRVRDGEHPLDATAIHPERYTALERLALRNGLAVADLLGPNAALVRDSSELRAEVGELTAADIAAELEARSRDPRDAFAPFQFRDDVHRIEDLEPGMICPGVVTNVTSFGAFVDVGVRQDGLVHVSQLSDRFVRDPREVVSPGDRVRVRVVEASVAKGQISLSMKLGDREGVPRGGERWREGRGAAMRARGEANTQRGAPPGALRGRAPVRRDRRDGGEGRAGPRDARPERGVKHHSSPQAAQGGPRSSAGRRPPEPFNNPFAVLLAKRDQFKPKP